MVRELQAARKTVPAPTAARPRHHRPSRCWTWRIVSAALLRVTAAQEHGWRFAQVELYLILTKDSNQLWFNRVKHVAMGAIRTSPALNQRLPPALQRHASLRHLTESRELKTARLRASEALQHRFVERLEGIAARTPIREHHTP